MLCPRCGAYNLDTERTCFHCKKILQSQPEDSAFALTPLSRYESFLEKTYPYLNTAADRLRAFDYTTLLSPMTFLVLFALIGVIATSGKSSALFSTVMVVLGTLGALFCVTYIVVRPERKPQVRRMVGNLCAFVAVVLITAPFVSERGAVAEGELITLADEGTPLTMSVPVPAETGYNWQGPIESLDFLEGAFAREILVEPGKDTVYIALQIHPSDDDADNKKIHRELLETILCTLNNQMIKQDPSIVKAEYGSYYGSLFDHYTASFSIALVDEPNTPIFEQVIPSGSHEPVRDFPDLSKIDAEKDLLADIGQTVESKHFRFTVRQVNRPQGEPAYTPATGKEIVEIEMVLENLTSETFSIDPDLMFTATADEIMVKESVAAHIISKNPRLEGALLPGGKLEGSIIYQTPKDWSQLDITINLNVLKESRDGMLRIAVVNNG